jgi:hypothetical protein
MEDGKRLNQKYQSRKADVLVHHFLFHRSQENVLGILDPRILLELATLALHILLDIFHALGVRIWKQKICLVDPLITENEVLILFTKVIHVILTLVTLAFQK